MSDEIREVIQEVYIDTGSPAVLFHYYETAQDVTTAKETRLFSGGEIRLQCLGKCLEGVNVYMSERVVCQLVLGYVDNQLEEQAGKIMREKEKREQERRPPTPQQPPSLTLPPLIPTPNQPTPPIPPTPQQPPSLTPPRQPLLIPSSQQPPLTPPTPQQPPLIPTPPQHRTPPIRHHHHHPQPPERSNSTNQSTPIQIRTQNNLASMTLQEQLALYSFPEPWKWECMSTVGVDLFASSLSPDHPISQKLIKSLCDTPRRVDIGTVTVRFVFELKSILKTLQDMKETPSNVNYFKTTLITQCESFFGTFYRLKYISTEKTLLVLFRNLIKMLSMSQKNALNQLMEGCRMAIVVQQSSVEWTNYRVRILLKLLLGSSEMKLLNESMPSYEDIGLLEMAKAIMLPNMYSVS